MTHEIVILSKDNYDEINTKLDKIIQKQELRVDPQEEWMDKPSVLKLLRVSSSTLQTYRDKGLIKYSQVGRKILYRVKDLHEFLDRNKFNNH